MVYPPVAPGGGTSSHRVGLFLRQFRLGCYHMLSARGVISLAVSLPGSRSCTTQNRKIAIIRTRGGKALCRVKWRHQRGGAFAESISGLDAAARRLWRVGVAGVVVAAKVPFLLQAYALVHHPRVPIPDNGNGMRIPSPTPRTSGLQSTASKITLQRRFASQNKSAPPKKQNTRPLPQC